MYQVFYLLKNFGYHYNLHSKVPFLSEYLLNTLAFALLCARASFKRSFSYLSWASAPPPEGGVGAAPFSPDIFFGLSDPKNI